MQACSPASIEQWQERYQALLLSRRARVGRLIEGLDREAAPRVLHGALKAIIHAEANEVELRQRTGA